MAPPQQGHVGGLGGKGASRSSSSCCSSHAKVKMNVASSSSSVRAGVEEIRLGAKAWLSALYDARAEFVQSYLDQYGTDMASKKLDNGSYPMHVAATMGSMSVMEVLLKYGGSYLDVDKMLRTPLHCAIENGHHEMVKGIMESILAEDGQQKSLRPLVTKKDRRKQTPLHLCLQQENEEINTELFGTMIGFVKDFLLDVKQKDLLYDLLRCSVLRGRRRSMVLLLEKPFRVNPDGKNIPGKNVRPVLIDACAEGQDVLAHILVKRGRASVNAVDSDGWTAAHWCFSMGHDALGKWLIREGADTTIKDNTGRTCMHWIEPDTKEGEEKTPSISASPPADATTATIETSSSPLPVSPLRCKLMKKKKKEEQLSKATERRAKEKEAEEKMRAQEWQRELSRVSKRVKNDFKGCFESELERHSRLDWSMGLNIDGLAKMSRELEEELAVTVAKNNCTDEHNNRFIASISNNNVKESKRPLSNKLKTSQCAAAGHAEAPIMSGPILQPYMEALNLNPTPACTPSPIRKRRKPSKVKSSPDKFHTQLELRQKFISREMKARNKSNVVDQNTKKPSEIPLPLQHQSSPQKLQRQPFLPSIPLLGGNLKDTNGSKSSNVKQTKKKRMSEGEMRRRRRRRRHSRLALGIGAGETKRTKSAESPRKPKPPTDGRRYSLSDLPAKTDGSSSSSSAANSSIETIVKRQAKAAFMVSAVLARGRKRASKALDGAITTTTSATSRSRRPGRTYRRRKNSVKSGSSNKRRTKEPQGNPEYRGSEKGKVENKFDSENESGDKKLPIMSPIKRKSLQTRKAAAALTEIRQYGQ